MLGTTNLTSSSTILQLLIDATNEDKVGGSESSGTKTNLSSPSTSKNSTGASNLTSEGTKKGGNNSQRGGGNTKTGVKAAGGFDYLTLDAKKAFNYLWHAFTEALIL